MNVAGSVMTSSSSGPTPLNSPRGTRTLSTAALPRSSAPASETIRAWTSASAAAMASIREVWLSMYCSGVRSIRQLARAAAIRMRGEKRLKFRRGERVNEVAEYWPSRSPCQDRGRLRRLRAGRWRLAYLDGPAKPHHSPWVAFRQPGMAGPRIVRGASRRHGVAGIRVARAPVAAIRDVFTRNPQLR